jgi:hypothetical protein
MSLLSVARSPAGRVDSSDDSRVQLSSRVALVFAVLLSLAFVLRVGVAVLSPNMEVSDETFATREPAHRLAYGYGLINPDWREGYRSWVFPAFLAGVMRATDWMGAGSSGYLLGIVLMLSLISLTTVWFSFAWAYRTGGVVAAVIAAGASAVWFELVYYGPKALSEVVAGHVILAGLYLGAFGESIPERRRLFISGLLFGLALGIRPPLSAPILFAAAVLGLKSARVRLPAIGAGLLTMFVLFGMIDAFTWGSPFHSFIRLFQVTIIQPVVMSKWAIETEQIRPWYWFSLSLAKRLGPMVLLAFVGVRRSPFLGWVALAILLSHSVVGHKEFRYIYPIIPLAITLAGLGLADALAALSARWRPLRSAAVACAAGLIVCVFASAVFARFFPLWSRYSGTLLAFQELSRDAKLCGLGLVGGEVDPTISGGYTYLHRNVPIYFLASADGADMRRLAPSFDAVVTAAPMAYEGFEQTRCWNGTCLYRRQGTCTASPADVVKFIPVE